MKFLKRIILILALIIPLTLSFINVRALSDDSYYSLYDEHLIMNKYQGDLGSCWAFSTTRVIETSLAKSYNEAFILSEGALISRNDKIGEGEYLTSAIELINRHDIAYEDDFNYENTSYVQNNSEGSNHSIINKYLDSIALNKLKMDDNLKLNPVIYSYKYDQELIKDHLRTKGAMMLSLNGYKYIENNKNSEVQSEISKGSLATHALTVIGYDDSYKCMDESIGAFILLNSNSFHQGRSILYLPYSYDIGYYSDSRNVIGVNIFKDNIADKLILNNINNTINEYGLNSSKNGFKKINRGFSDKNVFTADFNLSYTLMDGFNSLRVEDIKIYNNRSDLTNSFNINIGDNITIENKGKLEPGTYQILIDYSYMDSNNISYNISTKREAYIIGGFSASFIKNEDDSLIYSYNTIANNKDIIAFKHRANGVNKFHIYYRETPYNKAKYYRLDDIEYNLIDNEIIIASEFNETFIDKKLYFLDSDKNIIDEYNLRLYLLNDSLDNYIYAHIFYDGNNINSRLINSYIFNINDSDTKYYLDNSLKYELIGLNEEVLELPEDSNGYYLDLNLFKENKVAIGNYLTRRNPSLINRISYSIYLRVSNNSREVINLPSITTSFIYDGSNKIPLAINDSRLKISGNNGINSGSFNLIVEIIDKNKYVFSDGSTIINIPWVIEKKVIDIPDIKIAESYIYNGKPPFKIELGSEYLVIMDDDFMPGDHILKIYPANDNYKFKDKKYLEYKYKIEEATLEYEIIDNRVLFKDSYNALMYSYDGINYFNYSSDIIFNNGNVYFKALGYKELVVRIDYEEHIPDILPEDIETKPSIEENEGSNVVDNNKNNIVIIAIGSVLAILIVASSVVVIKRKWK